MDGLKFTHPVLREARSQFRSFYEIAPTNDVAWMDNLVLAYYTFRQGMGVPRELLPAANRRTLERACDSAERKFMRARDEVRECATFSQLSPGERVRIAGCLFDVFPPTE